MEGVREIYSDYQGIDQVEIEEENVFRLTEEIPQSHMTTTKEYFEYYDIFSRPVNISERDLNNDGKNRDYFLHDYAVSYRKFTITTSIVKFGASFAITEGDREYQGDFKLVNDERLKRINETNGLGNDRIDSIWFKMSILISIVLVLVAFVSSLPFFILDPLSMFLLFFIICFYMLIGLHFVFFRHREKSSQALVRLMRKHPVLQEIF